MSSKSSKITEHNYEVEKDYDRDRDYLPRARTWYKPNPDDLTSEAPDGSYTKLPNPLEDAIVSNNIACQEFDYTEGTYLDDELDLNPRQ